MIILQILEKYQGSVPIVYIVYYTSKSLPICILTAWLDFSVLMDDNCDLWIILPSTSMDILFVSCLCKLAIKVPTKLYYTKYKLVKHITGQANSGSIISLPITSTCYTFDLICLYKFWWEILNHRIMTTNIETPFFT
jgi:hypothetical protein